MCNWYEGQATLKTADCKEALTYTCSTAGAHTVSVKAQGPLAYAASVTYQGSVILAAPTAASVPATAVITVSNPPPVITTADVFFLPATALTGQAVTLKVPFVDASVVDSYKLVVQWGDGSASEEHTTLESPTGPKRFCVSHMYTAVGTALPVKLTITDSTAGVSTYTTSVNVAKPVSGACIAVASLCTLYAHRCGSFC
jgi:hypothetical protein